AALGNMSKLYCTRLHENSAVLGITRTSSVLHSLARKFAFEIFGCARHNPNKFGSALACTKIREIRGQKTLWAKNFAGKIIRGKKFRPYSVNARHTRS
ncbi:MAG: hypothetical protein ACOCNP_08585, partial [Bacteroidales bacterium]